MSRVLNQAESCTPELRLHGLLHDAHEAYIGDIPIPVAQAIGVGVIERLKAKLDFAIFEELLVPPPLMFDLAMLRVVDRRMLVTEARILIPGAVEDFHVFTEPYEFPWLREEITNPMPEDMVAGFLQYEILHVMEKLGD